MAENFEKISAAELETLLLDPEIPDSALRPYLMVDHSTSRAYRPEVRVNPSRVEGPGPAEGVRPEAAFLLSPLNGIARWRRQQRYRRKIDGWRGLRIVSEGDSWFQFPFLLEDVIDQLFDEYAIFSLDAAGDLLSDIVAQNELLGAVIAEKPHFVLLSGGGNDLLGSGRLTRHIEPFEPGRPAEAYLAMAFEQFLKSVIDDYRRLLTQLSSSAPDLRVLVHSYDFAIPNNGRWLGKPLAQAGIRDRALQKAIVAAILERLHAALLALAAEMGGAPRVEVVDCRGQVGDQSWWDELHPDDAGFAAVADRFRAAIESLRPVGRHTDISVESFAAPSVPPEEVKAVLALAAHSDTVLYREVGRRMTLAKLPSIATAQPSDIVPASSLEGGFDDFLGLGKRLLERLHGEVFRLLCGEADADKADRDALGNAVGAGEAALAGYLVKLLTDTFGLPSAAAVPLATLLIRRFFGPTWEQTCNAWSEKLAPQPQPAAMMLGPEPAGAAQTEARATPNEAHYCICITPDLLPSADIERLKSHRAAVLTETRWSPGTEIKIRFLEGTPHLRKRVKHYAEQWIGQDMANLNFAWIDRGKADIRIAFRQGKGSWSYLGTVCREIGNQAEPTMNYGWLTDQSTEDEIKRVVLHEFGHALGLIHEHQNPEGGIVWKEAAVIAALSGPPNNWSVAKIRNNVLNHYSPDDVLSSTLDPHSIMMYPIPAEWTVGAFSTGLNLDFTDTDRRIIRAAYS